MTRICLKLVIELHVSGLDSSTRQIWLHIEWQEHFYLKTWYVANHFRLWGSYPLGLKLV